MFNLRLIYRDLTNHFVFTIMSLAGLILGIACTFLIGIFILHESTYDFSQPNIDKIYTVYTKQHDASRSEKVAYSALPMAKALQNQLGDDILFCSLWQYTYPGVVFKTGKKALNSFTGFSTNQNFFRIFNFPLKSGNPIHLLDEPNTVVLTRSTALTMFGKENATGEIFSIDTLVFKVTGVLQDLPTNSQFRFDLLFSENVRYLFYPNFDVRWWEGGLQIFTLVKGSNELQRIRKTLIDIKANELSPEFREWYDYDIQAFKGLHMDNSMLGQTVVPVTRKYLITLFFIALSVLIIACLNYVIFSISLAEASFRETGILKVAGAKRNNLIILHLTEGILLSSIAVYLAFILARLLLPWFNTLTEVNISSSILDYRIIAAAFVLAILIGIFVTLYPAIYISNFSIVESLKLRSKGGEQNFLFRKILLVIQLVISISLISGEAIIIRQLKFMQNHDLGYDAKNLYSIQVSFLDRAFKIRMDKSKLFIAEMNQYASSLGLGKATISENIPGFYFQNQFKVSEDKGNPDNYEMIITSIDENFFEVYGINLLEGKNFKPGENASYFYAILNETAMHKLAWKNISGKSIRFHYDPSPIAVTGLVKDIHINSLQHAIEPVVYRYEDNNFPGFITFRLNPNKKKETLTLLKSTWEKLFPTSSFDGFFVEDKYNEKYGDEKRLISIIGTFSIISILLAVAGVIALISFIVTRRTKEAGIRKVHGASFTGIVFLFSAQLIRWVIFGSLLACPLSCYFAQKWLLQFPYRISMPWWIFVISGLIVLLLTVLSTIAIIWRAAQRNPVHALRYE